MFGLLTIPGIHDSVLLSWRLAGVINGLYKPEVLSIYSDERRASAQHLIENDKVISALISGHKPEAFKDRQVVKRFQAEAA